MQKSSHTKYIFGSHLYKIQKLAKPYIVFMSDNTKNYKEEQGNDNTIFKAVVIFGEGRKEINAGFEKMIMSYFLTWWWWWMVTVLLFFKLLSHTLQLCVTILKKRK